MTISLQLGYTNEDIEPTLSDARLAKANDLIAQLNAIDTALASATLDSMAVAVGELKVDYARHIALLKLEGSRLLKELSNISGIPIVYDRYYGSTAVVKSQPYSFQSYW